MSSTRSSARLHSAGKRNSSRTATWRKTDKYSEETSTESESENVENHNILNEMKAHGKRDKSATGGLVRKEHAIKRKTNVVDPHPENEKEQRGDLDASPPKLALLRLSTSTDARRNGAVDAVNRTTPTKRSKYQSARRVLSSNESQKLPGREQQLEELRDFLKEHTDKQCSGSLYVSGQPGTGKTACLSLLLSSPEFAQRLQCVYINCTSVASVGAVFKKLCVELTLQPAGRTERDHIAVIQRHLSRAPRMVLIVLDEIDQLSSLRQSVLYTIFEWPALPGARLLLVGIANSLDLTDRALMRLNSRCELKPRLLHFPPYTKQQIIEIFRTRLEEADVLDIFPPVTLQLLAAKVSAVSGDVRRALDIGRRVVEIAEQKKKSGQRELSVNDLNLEGDNARSEESPEPVKVAQVAEVLNGVYGVSQNLQEDIEDAFPLQQKILLCSLLLMLRHERNKNITMSRLYEVYRRVCAKRNIHSLDQTELFGLVDLVETRGILRLVRKKEPRLSKVQLQWDEEEVNGALKDKQLIAAILSDTACLAK